MRISIDWLKEFVDVPSSTEKTADMLTMLGLEAEQGLDAANYLLFVAHPIEIRDKKLLLHLWDPSSQEISKLEKLKSEAK
jgi:hypothetical protein